MLAAANITKYHGPQLVLSGVTLAVPLAAYAHHSFAATYFTDRTITLKGEVVQFMYRNPHTLLQIVVPDESGQSVRWAVEWAATLALTDAVTLTGAVRHETTPEYYRAANLFALSSNFDNSPNAVLEAMACGLPVVATDAGGVRNLVAPPAGGLVVPVGDAPALAAAIEHYLTAPELARAAGAHNRERATTEFSWRASALRLLEVYRPVVAERAAS